MHFSSYFGCLCWHQGFARWPLWEEAAVALCQRADCSSPITGHRYTHQPHLCSGKAFLGAASAAQRKGVHRTERVFNKQREHRCQEKEKNKDEYSMVEEIATLQPVGRTMATQMGVSWRSCDLWKSLHLGARGRMWQGRRIRQKPLYCLALWMFPSSFLIWRS